MQVKEREREIERERERERERDRVKRTRDRLQRTREKEEVQSRTERRVLEEMKADEGRGSSKQERGKLGDQWDIWNELQRTCQSIMRNWQKGGGRQKGCNVKPAAAAEEG